MRNLKNALIVICFLSINLLAQSPEKILKQAEKALGGNKNLQSIKSVRISGIITDSKNGTDGKYVLQTAQPNLFDQTYDLNGIEIESGFNGKSSWERDSRSGLQTLTGDKSRDLSVEAAFRNNLWLDYKKNKSKISFGGTANINGKPANIVILTSAKGVSVKLYFDALTNLPARYEFPAGDVTKIFDYSDYRLNNKVQIPYSVQLKQGDALYQIKIDEVKLNQQIAKSEFDYPPNSNEPLPNISQLLKELYSNTEAKTKIIEDYSYYQKISERELNDKGILKDKESATYQVSFYKGYNVYRQIEKNDQPLTQKEQEKADENAKKSLENVDKYITEQQEKKAKAKPEEKPEEKTNFYSEVLKASNLVNPRREKFRGRDVIVFDFEPNPNFDLKNAKSMLKVFGKVAGVIWVDEKDKEVVRMEAVLADNFNIGGGLVAKLQKGASFVLEQEYVNNEIWLPSLNEINLSARVLLVKGMKINQVIKTYNYGKFKTDVKEGKINEVKN